MAELAHLLVSLYFAFVSSLKSNTTFRACSYRPIVPRARLANLWYKGKQERERRCPICPHPLVRPQVDGIMR
ncbi:hypothetical protein EDD15DRAFT_1384332 [Pisolithus albus]|nr:hypothetical protein EDD15DRAFT_1384332 [Pisolithus albus]